MTYRELRKLLDHMPDSELDGEIQVYDDSNSTHADFVGIVLDEDKDTQKLFLEDGYNLYTFIVG